jgi:NitT/TauT family transport system permease protein
MRPTLRALFGLALFFLLWEAVPRLGLLAPILLPPPSSLPAALMRELNSGALLAALRNSLSHYAIGLTVGVLLGLVVGVLAGLFKPLDESLSWVVRVLRPIPGLAWVPFAIIWFGVSTAGAIFIIAIGVFWIEFFAALAAVQGVDRDQIELARAFGFGNWRQRLVKVVLPAATPGILAGIRTSLGQAWMAVVAAELFGVPGLGQRMMQASSLLATDLVLVYMLTIAAMYGLTDVVFNRVSRALLAYRA